MLCDHAPPPSPRPHTPCLSSSGTRSHRHLMSCSKRDAPQDVFQDVLRSYFTVSGLRRCHVLIKIQIPCIDCVIRLAQPGPGALIRPVIYDHFQEKSFCVIIWGSSLSEWSSFRSFLLHGRGGRGAKQTAATKLREDRYFQLKNCYDPVGFIERSRMLQSHMLWLVAFKLALFYCWMPLIIAT